MHFIFTAIMTVGVGAILIGFGTATLIMSANWLGWPSRHGRALFYGSLVLSTAAVVSLLIVQPMTLGPEGADRSMRGPEVEYGPQRR